MITEEHVAIVTNNADPEKRCRIKVACAGILGDEETELPMWVDPKLQWGWFAIPDVGELVDIEIKVSSDEDETHGQTSIDSPDICWKGTREYTSDSTEGQTQVRTPHEDFLVNYGKRRGFATPNGHILYFDDTEGKQKIQLTWCQKDGSTTKYSYITFDETGSVIIANKNGTYVHLDAEHEAMTIAEQHGNLISANEDGLKIIDKFANLIELKDGVIQIISQNAVVLTGKSLNVKTGSVDLIDGADAHLVRGEPFKLTYDTHIHPTGLGPSGPPAIPMPPTDLSTGARVK